MWVARFQPGATDIEVLHGSRVEHAEGWFFEGCWAGPLDEAGFDKTDVVAGSGGKVLDGGVIFVSPGSTRDRLAVSEAEHEILVSNSLAGVLVVSGDHLDPAYPHYQEDIETICRGIERYLPAVHTEDPERNVWLCYFDNLFFNGRALERREKRHPVDGFPSYAVYRDFLVTSIARVRDNAVDHRRQYPFEPLGTCSAGYDSPASLAVLTEAGPVDALVFEASQQGYPDSGGDIAMALGARPLVRRRSAYRRFLPRDMAVFFAADGTGEDLHFLGAQDLLENRLLITGFRGGRTWDISAKGTEDLYTNDLSGLSLTEFRLAVGFAHLPVPFLGARFGADILAIARSPEMAPWRVGGDYDRPIPRRILEDRGIRRGVFARRKLASSVLVADFPGSVLAATRQFAKTHGISQGNPSRLLIWLYRAYWYRGNNRFRILLRKATKLFMRGRFGDRWQGAFFSPNPVLMAWGVEEYRSRLSAPPMASSGP